MWRDDVLGIDPLTGRPFAQQQIPEDQAAVCENETLFAEERSLKTCAAHWMEMTSFIVEPFMVNRRESPSIHLLARSGSSRSLPVRWD